MGKFNKWGMQGVLIATWLQFAQFVGPRHLRSFVVFQNQLGDDSSGLPSRGSFFQKKHVPGILGRVYVILDPF